MDMSNWGKGMVWVNGHALGRFWEIGPQQTLYLPGCWLKKGKNEIIVLDLKGPAKTVVRGLKQPILDVLRTETGHGHRKAGENLQLKDENPIASGSFKSGNDWQEVKFDRQAMGRYFCFEAISSQGNDEFASVAEFEVLGTDGKPMSREKWKIRYADSEESRIGNYTAEKIFDLQESTYWMTIAKTAYPHQIVIDLGDEVPVTGFRYLPRAEKNALGMIKDYKAYVKANEFNY